MLFQVGPLMFSTLGLNTHEVERRYAADYAEKDVIGALRPAEFVGQGDDVMKLKCKLYVRHTPVGFSSLQIVEQMLLSGTPQWVTRGDGWGLGWRSITEATELHSHLDVSGRGRVIVYDMTLKLRPAPPPSAMLIALYGIVGNAFGNLFSRAFGR